MHRAERDAYKAALSGFAFVAPSQKAALCTVNVSTTHDGSGMAAIAKLLVVLPVTTRSAAAAVPKSG